MRSFVRSARGSWTKRECIIHGLQGTLIFWRGRETRGGEGWSAGLGKRVKRRVQRKKVGGIERGPEEGREEGRKGGPGRTRSERQPGGVQWRFHRPKGAISLYVTNVEKGRTGSRGEDGPRSAVVRAGKKGYGRWAGMTVGGGGWGGGGSEREERKIRVARRGKRGDRETDMRLLASFPRGSRVYVASLSPLFIPSNSRSYSLSGIIPTTPHKPCNSLREPAHVLRPPFIPSVVTCSLYSLAQHPK